MRWRSPAARGRTDAGVASDCRPQAFASRTAAERVQTGAGYPGASLKFSQRRLTPFFHGLLAAALLLIASGCTSYSQTERAKSQIAFGSEVARKGLWREAVFRFEQAIAKEPANARAHNNLAVALEATGEFARALEEYKKALQLDPNDSYIHRNYARFAEFYTSYTRTTGKAAGAS
jgi:tetratricopeptide (TPR) repeat protein